MSFTYDVSADALTDLREIELYEMAFKEPADVDALLGLFVETFRRLCENPFAYQLYAFDFPAHTMHEYRTVNVEKYKVFYWVEDEVVHIYRIRHMKSDFTRAKF